MESDQSDDECNRI
ncbi:hypothetical protein PI125_g23390, partial [Phytophthora idaei]